MNFYNKIAEIAREKDVVLFVDMDGVIASYEINKPYDFLIKRPIMSNIKTIEELQNIPNVELHILSACRKDFQMEEKNKWLDKYAPFFKKENRTIISKEHMDIISSKEAKANFLNVFKTDKQIVVVDDDNDVLRYLNERVENIILFQDSELVD